MNSPSYINKRTFKLEFDLSLLFVRQNKKKKYINPIYISIDWEKMLNSGNFKTQADLAKYLGVSRVRVVQMLNLLKLDSQVIDTLKGFGETFDKKLFGEKTLRALLKLDPENQRLRLKKQNGL